MAADRPGYEGAAFVLKRASLPAIRGFGEQLDEPSGVERLQKKVSDTKGSKVSATIHTAVADYARLPLKQIELLD